ncbi:MAG TPA: hypothetical protein IAA29_11930 [Candidatus Paenibacillus intestinavium]|nr:hypothetical protein [Candidatus Paenibacillus intestinavium]
MNQEQVVEKLMSQGLSEVQAIEVFVSRNERDLTAILDFLHFYGEHIIC